MQEQWNIRSKEVRRGIGIDSRVSYLMCNGESSRQTNVFIDATASLWLTHTANRCQTWCGHTCAHRLSDMDTHIQYIHTHICYNTIHLIFIVRVGWVFLIRLMVSAAFRYFSCTTRLCWRKLVIFIILFWVIIAIINTLCWTNSFTIYCTLFILIVV